MVESPTVSGRLVVDGDVFGGHVVVEEGLITAIDPDASVDTAMTVVPGFIDVHVHGWGGHDAMGGAEALSGMARALARHGVTSFLPTAVTAPFDALATFAETVRTWAPSAPDDGAAALGFNLEGPFLAPGRKGAHTAALLREPADVDAATMAPLLDGLRIITMAPELPGALELIERLARRGVVISLGHSAASAAGARAGYEAGARSTTHLFNAMSGFDHRAPGLAVEALLRDEAWVELIADGQHVDPALWHVIWRLKPADRVLLVSDAVALAGSGKTSGQIGGLEVELSGDRVTLAGTNTLAGSVTSIDAELHNVVSAGVGLADAVAAASSTPAALLGLDDRGRLAVGRRADIVLLDDDLRVARVMRGGSWLL